MIGKIISATSDEENTDRGVFEIKGHGLKNVLFYIKPHAYREDDVLALTPHIYVASTKKPDDVNVEVKWLPCAGHVRFAKVPKDLNKVLLPVFRNTKALPAATELKLFHESTDDPKEKRQSLLMDCGISKKHKTA